jgi:hypothetical protein
MSAFNCITAAEPSPDLLSLVRLLNPSFLFATLERCTRTVLEWLKVCSATDVVVVRLISFQKFETPPEDLIQLWEDYAFMELWDDLYNDLESSKKKQLFGRSPLPASQLSISRA